ncbi:MAG TPA: valine--tRNA ligase, partial [Anaerolineales bacterium]|nr:valine--tRNA ligase [Anaerolineales bacterium]
TDFNLVQEIVRSIRNLRAEKNVKPGRRIPAILVGGEQTKMLQTQSVAIASLAQLDGQSLQIVRQLSAKPEGHIGLVIGAVEIFLPLAGLVDVSEERTRLEKDLASVNAQIQRLEGLLASSFAEKAPANVVQKEREKLEGYLETARRLKAQLAGLSE